MQALRHDKPLHSAKIQSHMKHVPDYMIPKKKINVNAGSAVGYVPFKVEKKGRGKKYFKKPVGAAAKV